MPIEATFSMSILFPGHHGQSFNSWYIATNFQKSPVFWFTLYS